MLLDGSTRQASRGKRAASGASCEQVTIRQVEHNSPDSTFKARVKNSIDGTLLTLRKERGSATTFKPIKAGKVTVTEVARERGVLPQGALTRYLKPGWRTASEDERREFIKWLRQEADLASICAVDSRPRSSG
jgi:hypothetical protein